MKQTLSEVNESFRTWLARSAIDVKQVGCTALFLLLSGTRCLVANVGDTRAVLKRSASVMRLSHDHKAYDQEEQDRIRQAGGWVSGEVGRVNGLIAVTRSIGDFYMRPFVTCEPYLREIELTPEDETIIIGCDGVWDVFTDEEAVAIVAAAPDPVQAAARLRDAAYVAGSDDNISVIVIKLK